MSDPYSTDPARPDPDADRPQPPGHASAPPPAPYGNAPAYPSAPPYGQAGSQPPTTPPADPPPPLALAVRLMYAGAALALVEALLTLTQRSQLRSQVVRGGTPASAVDTAVTAAIISAVVIGVLAAGLWVLNAVFNARGATWARILSTVLGALAVVFTVLGFTQPAGGLSRVLSVVQLLLAIGVLVLIWRPESSAYYRARSGVPAA